MTPGSEVDYRDRRPAPAPMPDVPELGITCRPSWPARGALLDRGTAACVRARDGILKSESLIACGTRLKKIDELNHQKLRGLAGSEYLCYCSFGMVSSHIQAADAALLEQIRQTFGLSKSKLADLFRRRPQTVAEWYERGIPPELHATAERIADLARVFQRNIIASRIPEVVTTSDSWLGNKTILEVLEADGVDPIYSYLARLFAYQG